MTNNKKVEPIASLPRGTAHPVTKLAISYLRTLNQDALLQAADKLDSDISNGSVDPYMGSVSETLRRVVSKDSVSDRYLNSAAFYVLYNVVLANQQAMKDENPAS